MLSNRSQHPLKCEPDPKRRKLNAPGGTEVPTGGSNTEEPSSGDASTEESASGSMDEPATAATNTEVPTATEPGTASGSEPATAATNTEVPTAATNTEVPTATEPARDASMEVPTAATNTEEPTGGANTEEPGTGDTSMEGQAGFGGTNTEVSTGGSMEVPGSGANTEVPTASESASESASDVSMGQPGDIELVGFTISTERREFVVRVLKSYMEEVTKRAVKQELPREWECLRNYGCEFCKHNLKHSFGLICKKHDAGYKKNGFQHAHLMNFDFPRQLAGEPAPSKVEKKSDREYWLTLPQACNFVDASERDAINKQLQQRFVVWRELQVEKDDDEKRRKTHDKEEISAKKNAQSARLKKAYPSLPCGLLKPTGENQWQCSICKVVLDTGGSLIQFKGVVPCAGIIKSTFDDSIIATKNLVAQNSEEWDTLTAEKKTLDQTIARLEQEKVNRKAEHIAERDAEKRKQREMVEEELKESVVYRQQEVVKKELAEMEAHRGVLPEKESKIYMSKEKDRNKQVATLEVSISREREKLKEKLRKSTFRLRFHALSENAKKRREELQIKYDRATERLNAVERRCAEINQKKSLLEEYVSGREKQIQEKRLEDFQRCVKTINKVPMNFKPTPFNGRSPAAKERFDALMKKSYPKCHGDILIEITATETRYRCMKCDKDFHGFGSIYSGDIGILGHLYNLVNANETELATNVEDYLKNRSGMSDFRDYYYEVTIDGIKRTRFPNDLLYKPIVHALQLERYPVNLQDGHIMNLFTLLKSCPIDVQIGKKIERALLFLKCNGTPDDKERAETVYPEFAKQVKSVMKKHRKNGYIETPDWTRKCELCHHASIDPSFQTRRESALSMLNDAVMCKLDRKGSVAMSMYRQLVVDHPNADHSIADGDELLYCYLRAEIDARQLKRVGKTVYEDFKPIGPLSKLCDHIRIKSITALMTNKVVKRLKGEWEDAEQVDGVRFNNGYIGEDGTFHTECDCLCREYIDEDYEAVSVSTDYDDMHGFTPIDKHTVYAAFGAALLSQSTWKIQFEGKVTLKCQDQVKKIFETTYARIRGDTMMIPPFDCIIAFSQKKALQSYLLLRDYGTSWTDFCQLGPSRIYERLQYKPDSIAEFVTNELVCRRLRETPGVLDVSYFDRVRGGAFTVTGNRYEIPIGRGNPAEYPDVTAVTLLDARNRYISWCDRLPERGAFRKFFEQPSIAPIREELAKHNIVCINVNLDLKSPGAWKDDLRQTNYLHKNYVLLGCSVRPLV